MIASARPRLRLPAPRGALPPALLALALASVFVFGHDRSQFYRPSTHDYVSAETLSIASHFSAEHGFTGVLRWKRGDGGEPLYVVYNRHPVGPTVLVRLAILPFGDDIPRQIGAARLLMLACFAAAAAFAWLALARLLGDRWIALAATLLACSSYYLLYYNDMISAVASTSLLGVTLAFHGMAIYAQEGRFRQLLARTAVALLLGWHAAGPVAAFALIGLGGRLLRARAEGATPRAALAALARSRCLALGAFAALCCALLLGFNLATEYLALRGEVPPHELPSLRSVLSRAGAGPAYTGGFGWAEFVRGQLAGVGGLTLPFALAEGRGLPMPHYGLWPPPDAAAPFAALGAAVAAICFAGLRLLPQRALFAALLLGGWAWAIPFRGTTALHEFEAILHVGFPLTLGALALPALRRLGRERAAPALALAALALFVLSAWRMGGAGHDAAAADLQRELTADFRAMRAAAEDRGVLYAAMMRASVPEHGRAVRGGYWLAGSRVALDPIGSGEEWARATATAGRGLVAAFADLGGSLTPHNRRAFLYEAAALPAAYDAIAAAEPALRSRFDVRLDGDGRALTLARGECSGDDAARPFRLEAVPLDAADLPPAARAAGFETFVFGLHDAGLRFGGRCLARIALPDYPVAGVRVGQRADDLPPLWEASIPVEDASFPLEASGWGDAFEGREPAARGPFDVYLDGRALTFVRDACIEAHARPRFFLHVTPLDAADLPEERRASGFGNLDFAFAERGLRHEGRCVARVPLPDYGIARIRTGQFESGVRLWEAEFAFPAGE